MSYTKMMRRWVLSASKADLACRKDALETSLMIEKNVAKRSSYKEQIGIIMHEQERRWHEAETESYIPKERD